MTRSSLLRIVGALMVVAFVSPCFVWAQPPGGFGGGPGGPGGFGGPGGGGLLGIITREDVQQEIQLVDEQRNKVMDVVDEARDEMRNEMRSMFEEMRDLSEEERRERFGEIREKMEKMNSDVESKLKKALLPHQLERLKQIELQTRMQQRGEGGLSSRAIADALDLTEEQREKLEKRAEEVRAELQDQIREAQAKAREKLLDVLTPAQKAKFEELMGDTFQMSDENRFGRGGFRGRDGGSGGREGGRRDGGRSERGRERRGFN